MLILLKAILRRPLAESDLLSAAGSLLARPPLPPEVRDTLAGIRADREGTSVLDYWRGGFRSALREIAAEPTWGLQRAKLLATTVETYPLRALHAVAESAKHDESWLPRFRRAEPKLADASVETCKRLLTQHWLIALCTDVCLQVLGNRYYGVGRTKDRELELLDLWGTDLDKLRVALLDYVLDAALAENTRLNDIVRWHDDIARPLLDEEGRVLSALEEEVVHSNVDVQNVTAKRAELNEKKIAAERHLAALLSAADGPES